MLIKAFKTKSYHLAHERSYIKVQTKMSRKKDQKNNSWYNYLSNLSNIDFDLKMRVQFCYRHSESAWFRFCVSDFLFVRLRFPHYAPGFVTFFCFCFCFWLCEFDFVIVVQVKFLTREHISQARSRKHVGG